MRDHKLTPILLTGLLALTLLGFSAGATTRAAVRQDDAPLTPQAYFPFVARSYIQVRYPSDVDYEKQWALETINAPQAWALSTGRDIVIAVIDTGVDLQHVDLSSKLVSEGWHFLGDDAGPGADDDNGHGTHVAGIAAAATDNDIGIAGIGWDAKILPLKVLDETGAGSFADVALAIDYAVTNGADVINLSIGVKTDRSLDCSLEDLTDLQQAIDAAHSAGVVMIAAGGNNGNPEKDWIETPPANCDHVLGIAATTLTDSIATYSSLGSHISVAAPGGDDQDALIYSTTPNDKYAYNSGTSMATPHVSGLATLVLALYPGYTPDQVASAILDNALDLGSSGWDAESGCGRIDSSQTLLNGAHGPEPVCPGVTSWAEAEPQAEGKAAFVPGEIIVEFRSSTAAASLISEHTVSAEFLHGLNAWRLSVPLGQERVTLDRLRADSNVLHAGLNYLVFAQD